MTGRLLGKTPLLILQLLLERLPLRPVELALLYVVRFDGVPDIKCDGGVEVHAAGPDDVEELAKCMAKRGKFRKRFMQGDYCLLARVDGGAAGYMWFCTNASHVEEKCGYELRIPHGAVYCYDEYVRPEYRKRGVFKHMYGKLAAWMRERRKNAVISMIAHGNEVSRNIHMKVGFRPVRRILYLRIFGLRIFRERAM